MGFAHCRRACGPRVIDLCVGLMLPKGHTASRTLRLKQPPEPVWQALADAAAMASWRANVDRVERLPDQDGHEVWQEVYKDGWKLPLMRVSVEPPHRLVGKIADPKLPFGGTWTFEIQPVDGGCRVVITERGEVYSPVFRSVLAISRYEEDDQRV